MDISLCLLGSSFQKLKWGPSYTKIDSTPECYSIKALQPEVCLMSYFNLDVSLNTRINYRRLRNTPKNISFQNVFVRGICLYFVSVFEEWEREVKSSLLLRRRKLRGEYGSS